MGGDRIVYHPVYCPVRKAVGPVAASSQRDAPRAPAADRYDRDVTGQPPPYSPQPYGQPGYGYGRPPAPKPTSTKGPKITLAIGVVVLVAAVVVGVLAGRAIVGLIPTDVLRMDGSPGDGVLAVVDAPGSGEVSLEGGSTYSVYLVTAGRDTALDGAPVITDPDGDRTQPGTGSMSSDVEMNGTRAELVAVVEPDRSGTYTVEAPTTLDGYGGQLYVTEGSAMGDVLGGVFGGVFGIIAAVGLGCIALVLMLVGGIMWGVRRGNARQVGQP